jgi:hypothetical protein
LDKQRCCGKVLAADCCRQCFVRGLGLFEMTNVVLISFSEELADNCAEILIELCQYEVTRCAGNTDVEADISISTFLLMIGEDGSFALLQIKMHLMDICITAVGTGQPYNFFFEERTYGIDFFKFCTAQPLGERLLFNFRGHNSAEALRTLRIPEMASDFTASLMVDLPTAYSSISSGSAGIFSPIFSLPLLISFFIAMLTFSDNFIVFKQIKHLTFQSYGIS